MCINVDFWFLSQEQSIKKFSQKGQIAESQSSVLLHNRHGKHLSFKKITSLEWQDKAASLRDIEVLAQRVAACCSVLQRVASCCIMMQCVAACCTCCLLALLRVLLWRFMCVAVRCSALQRIAVCCGVLQQVAVCCSALQYVAPVISSLLLASSSDVSCVLQCVAAHCSALHCDAARCSMLQYVAPGVSSLFFASSCDTSCLSTPSSSKTLCVLQCASMTCTSHAVSP